jgi:hypothetical protein
VKARATGPVLIHVLTKKGKGYAPAEAARDKGHATGKFDVLTGVQVKAASNAPSYTKVFAKPGGRGRAGRQDRRGDGGDAGRDRAGPVRRAVPEAVL